MNYPIVYERPESESYRKLALRNLKNLKARGDEGMNLVALQKEIERMSTALRMSGDLTDSRLMEMKVEIDKLKLEIAALNSFLEQTFPSFAQVYPDVKERIFREINPELD